MEQASELMGHGLVTWSRACKNISSKVRKRSYIYSNYMIYETLHVCYKQTRPYMGRTRPSRELKQDLMKLAFCEFQVFGILKLNLLLAGIWYLLVSSQILYLYRALQMLYL